MHRRMNDYHPFLRACGLRREEELEAYKSRIKKKKGSRENPGKSKEQSPGTKDNVLSCLVILRGRLSSFPVMVTFMCPGFMGLHGPSTHFIFHLLKLLTSASDFNTYFQGHSAQNAVVMKGNRASKRKTKGSPCLHRVRS